MSILSDKFYSAEELKLIALQNNISEEYHIDFIKKFESEVEIMNEQEFDKESIKTYGLKVSIAYGLKLESELKKGHSRAWAESYANSFEEHQHAFNDAYDVVKALDLDLAIEELRIHCKSIKADALYFERFCFLMENNATGQPGPDDQAGTYSKVFKEQISLGKSKIFAHHYSDLTAEDSHTESYCYSVAKAYDEASNVVRNESTTRRYAYSMGDYYGNQYSSSKEILYDEIDKLNEAEIIAKLKAIEYAAENKLPNSELFVQVFQDEYIKEIQPEFDKIKLATTELDQVILQRALEISNKK